MASSWTHGIVKDGWAQMMWRGNSGWVQGRRETRSTAHSHHPWPLVCLWLWQLRCFFFYLFYAINVSNAVPFTSCSFNFPVKSAKLKEKSHFTDEKKPISSRPEILSMGDWVPQSREHSMDVFWETAVQFMQQPVRCSFPLLHSQPGAGMES